MPHIIELRLELLILVLQILHGVIALELQVLHLSDTEARIRLNRFKLLINNRVATCALITKLTDLRHRIREQYLKLFDLSTLRSGCR